MKFTYKTACTPYEMEQIYALNYETFVEEIPQHDANTSKKLIDKFDKENLYIIALDEKGRLAGMICIRAKRPFSLDSKISDLDRFLPPGKKLCEIRLLAILPTYRKTGVLKGLIRKLYEIAEPQGYEIALISGTDRQLALYEHIGFEIFADPVGTNDALFYPMYITIDTIKANPLLA